MHRFCELLLIFAKFLLIVSAKLYGEVGGACNSAVLSALRSARARAAALSLSLSLSLTELASYLCR